MLSGVLPLYLTGAFLTALVASLLGTYVVRAWALRRDYVDHPDNDRRLHSHPTPNVGGTAVALSSVSAFVAWSFVVVPGHVARPEILAMLIGGLLTFAVGFWDDTRHLRAGAKFAAQFVIATLAFLGGVRILGVSFGGMWQSQLTALMSFGVTALWVVGTTNAINLIDGSDGVAAGAALFASTALAVVFALNQDPLGALMAVVLVGSCLGFLFFNFPPASIFLGDSGSLFLGFTLATLGVITTQKTSTLLAIAIPIVAVGIPLLDTCIAMVRRFLRHKSIFSPDREHIHHKLRDLGHSPRAVALVLYVGCAGCASLSMLLAAPGRTTVLPVFVVAAAVVILAVQRLNVPELTELRRMFGRGLQQRLVISHNLRLYSAGEALVAASDGKAVADALEQAFKGSEFSRIELRVEEPLGSGLQGIDAHVSSDGSITVWSMTFERMLGPLQPMELRVPLIYNDRAIGSLSVFRTTQGDRLYTDVRLLARHVAIPLVSTLRRISVSLDGARGTAGA